MLMKRMPYEKKWNQHGLIFEENREVIDVGYLSSDSDKQEMLVTGNYDQQDFEYFILSHMSVDNGFSRSSLTFDIKRIKRHVWTATSIIYLYLLFC